MPKINNYTTKTCSFPLNLTDDGEKSLLKIGNTLGEIRNWDYSQLSKSIELGKNPTKLDRRKSIVEKYGINKREADNIVYRNFQQLDLSQRSNELSIDNWINDLKEYQKRLEVEKNPWSRRDIFSKMQSIESKIEKRSKKKISCCFGGSKLQRKITSNPDNNKLIEDWRNKRLFFDFIGESGRSHGNASIKFNVETGEVLLFISKGLAVLSNIESRKIVLGSCNVKFYRKLVSENISNNIATTFSVRWNTKKRCWYLYINTRLSQKYQKDNLDLKRKTSPVVKRDRVCAIDQNSGFVTVSIVDKNGNRVAYRRINHDHSRDISSLISSIVDWSIYHGASFFAIEKLTGLHRNKRRSKSSSKALNRCINKIPYGEFSQRLKSTADTYGLEVRKVNPYHTSKLTTQWEEDHFGKDIHDKASYLIGRRAWGLSIQRPCFNDNPKGNGVFRRAILDKYGEKDCNIQGKHSPAMPELA